MDRFHKNAHKALEKRTVRFLLQEVFEGFQFVLFGSLPIVGLFYWGWQPLHLLLFLLVGAWVGLICDCFKLYFLKKAIMEYADGRYDDWHVWVVADALRKGQEKARAQHLRAKYQPGAGVFVNFQNGILYFRSGSTIRCGRLVSPQHRRGDPVVAYSLPASPCGTSAPVNSSWR